MYENLDLTASRYSIEVPITPYERQLFNNSVTNIELISEDLLSSMMRGLTEYYSGLRQNMPHSFIQGELDIYFSQLPKKRLPIPLIRHYLQNERNLSECTQYLLKRGYIRDSGSSRKTIEGQQFRYYDILRWDALEEFIHRMDGTADRDDNIFTASGVASE